MFVLAKNSYKYLKKNLSIVFSVDFVEFTDEEGYGKYLDLHECYEKYINLKGIEVRKLLHFIS